MTVSPERKALEAEVGRLWRLGLTTSEIGAKLDITKNAVVGMAHRLNLPKRPSPIRRRLPQEGLASSSTPKPRAARPKRTVVPAAVKKRATTTRGEGCRWIEGEPAGRNTVYCNQPRVVGRAWCPEHYARVYRVVVKSDALDHTIPATPPSF